MIPSSLLICLHSEVFAQLPLFFISFLTKGYNNSPT